MRNPPSIVFLIPYFGQWPFWMPFFLESCRHNPDVDWLLFSDCGTPENLPANVSIHEISYEAYCQLVSERLGISFVPRNSYKLCDIKQALGYIHQDMLDGYDFWAFGDIDLIYGDLRAYFTVERLARFDLFSTHRRRVSGHLCLLRNTSRMREAFMLIPNWRRRFSDQKHHALDEGAFSRIFLWRKNFPEPLFNLLGKLNPWRRRSEFVEAYSTPNAGVDWVDGSRDFPEKWFWRSGKLFNDRDKEREFPYFHFAVWKKEPWGALPQPSSEQLLERAARPSWVVSARGFE